MELQICGVSKTYANGVQALKDVTLTIPAGMYGLLGPNGAGKSTLMRILATLQEADSGSATIGGIDVLSQKDEVRKTLGYLPQEFGVYPKVSAEELLEHFAVLKGIVGRRVRKEVVEALLRQTNLWEVRKQKLGGYSGGMRQRVGIAQALLNNPELLIVDEPTAGLDPGERVRFRNLLSELSTSRIIILSTHIVSDVEAVAGRIALVSRGTLMFHDAPEALLQRVQGRVWEWSVVTSELPEVRRKFAVSSALHRGDGVAVRVVSEQAPHPAARNVVPSLEDVYLQATWDSGAHTA
jgi:ABC-2 type transport system ATP-binding protein